MGIRQAKDSVVVGLDADCAGAVYVEGFAANMHELKCVVYILQEAISLYYHYGTH